MDREWTGDRLPNAEVVKGCITAMHFALSGDIVANRLPSVEVFKIVLKECRMKHQHIFMSVAGILAIAAVKIAQVPRMSFERQVDKTQRICGDSSWECIDTSRLDMVKDSSRHTCRGFGLAYENKRVSCVDHCESVTVNATS